MSSWKSEWLKICFSKSFILDVWLRSEYTSGSVIYLHQNLHLKSVIRLWICRCLYWVWQFIMKLAKYVMKKLKRMAINMFGLFLGIAVQKFSQIFDFGWQTINWVACSMTLLLFVLLLQFMAAHQHMTDWEWLPQTYYELESS